MQQLPRTACTGNHGAHPTPQTKWHSFHGLATQATEGDNSRGVEGSTQRAQNQARAAQSRTMAGGGGGRIRGQMEGESGRIYSRPLFKARPQQQHDDLRLHRHHKHHLHAFNDTVNVDRDDNDHNDSNDHDDHHGHHSSPAAHRHCPR